MGSYAREQSRWTVRPRLECPRHSKWQSHNQHLDKISDRTQAVVGDVCQIVIKDAWLFQESRLICLLCTWGQEAHCPADLEQELISEGTSLVDSLAALVLVERPLHVRTFRALRSESRCDGGIALRLASCGFPSSLRDHLTISTKRRF